MRVFFTVLLLCVSNVFMTFAWYSHLRKDHYVGKSLIWVIIISWSIAFFEYCFMIPANRLGSSAGLSTAQLKVIQEAVTLCIFIPFSVLYMGEHWKWDYLWAFLCVLGAVFFVNRESLLG